MVRLQAIDYDQTDDRARELLDEFGRLRGDVPTMALLMARSPAVLRGYLAFGDALDEGTLSPRLREQLALVVSETDRCDYSICIHTAAARALGLADEEIAAAREANAADAKTRAALEFAQTVTEYRGEITDEEFARLRHAGYTDVEIVEIVGNVLLHICTDYFNTIVQPALDDPALYRR
jgi:uncharacterized peroxidase-related enzyme